MIPNRVGWYRQAKSGTHHGETPGLCVHKIAMEVGSDATPEDLMKALGDGDLRVRMAAARHPNATPEVLMRALGDMKSDVRWEAAKHPNATPAVLMRALWDGSESVRWAAAGHPNATPEVLMKALEDDSAPTSHYIRWSAAKHPNATPEVLMKALGDEHPDVRRAAARNQNANPGIGVEWVINALKSLPKSKIPAYLKELRVHDGQFPLSDLVRLVITDRRVDLDGLDLFQKGLEESQFAQYAPSFRRMIGQEKIRRKDGS